MVRWFVRVIRVIVQFVFVIRIFFSVDLRSWQAAGGKSGAPLTREMQKFSNLLTYFRSYARKIRCEMPFLIIYSPLPPTVEGGKFPYPLPKFATDMRTYIKIAQNK